MKFTAGSLIINPRGSIGGTSFGRNASGNFARARTIPRDRKSLLQSGQRNIVAYVSRAWRGLSVIGQNSWKSFASTIIFYDSLGNPYKLTGNQMFMKCNLNLVSNNYPIHLIVPDPTSQSPVQLTYGLFQVSIIMGLMSMQFNYLPISTVNEAIIIESSGAVSPGISKIVNWKKIACVPSSSTTPVHIEAGFEKAFGYFPAVHNVVWFKVWKIDNDTGLWTSQLILNATCVSM